MNNAEKWVKEKGLLSVLESLIETEGAGDGYECRHCVGCDASHMNCREGALEWLKAESE